MSRGFVKEDDQEEIPLVPPRADLPEGVTNYVTQVGMDALLAERENLNDKLANLTSINDKELRIATNHINAILQLLAARIASAKIIDFKNQKKDEIRFGATITFNNSATKTKQTFQLVGVDEADISSGKLAFITPVAKALIGKQVGDKAVLDLGTRKVVFDILKIEYK